MTINRKWLGIGLMVGLVTAAIVYAATVDQIMNAVFDSSNSALRINIVTSTGS